MKNIRSKPRVNKIAGHNVEWIYSIYEGGEPLDISEISESTRKYIIEGMESDKIEGCEPAGEGSVFWKIIDNNKL